MTTDNTLTGRGGAGRGQGRKPLAEETVRYCFLMTTAQRATLDKLGNAEWIRAELDKQAQHVAGQATS